MVSENKRPTAIKLCRKKRVNVMAIKLKELIENPALLQEKIGQGCASCGVLLQESITGKRKTSAGDVCSDCYYEKMGELIDQHPIVCGRVRRG